MQESLAAKFVTFPLWTLKFHSPDKITLKALVILNPVVDSGTVITKDLIVPIAENVSCLLLILMMLLMMMYL